MSSFFARLRGSDWLSSVRQLAFHDRQGLPDLVDFHFLAGLSLDMHRRFCGGGITPQ